MVTAKKGDQKPDGNFSETKPLTFSSDSVSMNIHSHELVDTDTEMLPCAVLLKIIHSIVFTILYTTTIPMNALVEMNRSSKINCLQTANTI